MVKDTDGRHRREITSGLLIHDDSCLGPGPPRTFRDSIQDTIEESRI
jgi:hypothetical protein